MKTKQSKRMETTQPAPTKPLVPKMLRQGLKCRQFIWEMAPGGQIKGMEESVAEEEKPKQGVCY